MYLKKKFTFKEHSSQCSWGLPSDLDNPKVLGGGAQRCPPQFESYIKGRDMDLTLGQGTIIYGVDHKAKM